ncbi:MAG: PIN domain-containing protein [Candidatus Omnitrophica bacterium]|nr:PIN domain-containing protein [Candidatus Omnitrophota bacterium]
MKKIFIDTDVFLDTILDRKPYSDFSKKIVGLCERNNIEGYTSALVIANIYYIIKRLANKKKAMQAIANIRSLIKVLSVTDKEIGESINAEFDDFEDGVQYFVAMNNKLNCFITRNVKDYGKASIGILTPEEYLQTLAT